MTAPTWIRQPHRDRAMAVGILILLVAALVAAHAATAHDAASRTPPTPPAPPGHPDSGRLPDDVLCHAFGGPECSKPSSPHRVRRQQDVGDVDGQGNANAPSGDVDQEQICSIFGGPSCPPDPNRSYDTCECPAGSGGDCQCVPYYLCDSTSGGIKTDGSDLLDIRLGTRNGSVCAHYAYQCCKIRDADGGVGDPNPNPNPGPNPGPNPDPNPGPDPDPNPQPGDYNPGGQAACGVRNRRGVGMRISGALEGEVQFGEMPWMVAVFAGNAEYLCGGALIAPNVVITAAHCVNGKMPLQIRAGEWDSLTESEAYKHQIRDVAEVRVHPDYKEKSVHNDVALLFLGEPVQLGFHIGTVCLPDQGQNFERRDCLVTGWGKDKFGQEGIYQNILRKIDLPVVPHMQCQDALRRTRLGAYFKLNPSFLCAGGIKGRDTCTGDGGSPLVCPTGSSEDATYVLAGLVSWGVGCGEEGVPGVYAKVALFRNWIDQQLG